MAQQERRRILFVGGVAPHISEQALFEHFSQFSDLTKVRIMREKKTRESKGYAYITVADSRSIPLILGLSHEVIGRKLDVQLSTPRSKKKDQRDHDKFRRVYVFNLEPETTDKELFHAFSCFGVVRNAYVVRSQGFEAQKEYGYVHFEDGIAAQAAIRSKVKLRGHVLIVHRFATRSRLSSKQQDGNKLDNHQKYGKLAGKQTVKILSDHSLSQQALMVFSKPDGYFRKLGSGKIR